MASTDGRVAPAAKGMSGRQTLLLAAALVTGLAVATLAVSAGTTRGGGAEQPTARSLAFPCRHQMSLSQQAPSCRLHGAGDVTPAEVIEPKPHGFPGPTHTTCAKDLWFRGRGWECPGSHSGAGVDR
jgi:hypothetical protein